MKPWTAVVGLGAALAVLGAGSLMTGVAAWGPDVLFQSRVPRLAAVVFSGAALALAGLILQQLSGNRFVSPDTASTVEWGSLGFLVGLIWFPQVPLMVRTALAFVAGLAGTLGFLALASRLPSRDAMLVPVLGLALGVAVGSVSTALAWATDLVQPLAAWTGGDFSLVVEGRWEVLWVIVPAVALAAWFSDALTVAGLGDEPARALGLPYRTVVVLGVALASLLTAAVLSVGGIFPFLGLVIPRLVTLLWGDHLRTNLPLAALSGGVFLLFCDLVGRWVVFPFELPLGMTSGLAGALVFFLVGRRAFRG